MKRTIRLKCTSIIDDCVLLKEEEERIYDYANQSLKIIYTNPW